MNCQKGDPVCMCKPDLLYLFINCIIIVNCSNREAENKHR